MSTAPVTRLVLDDGFARDLPELAVAWRAADWSSPRLLALNEPLAAELGLDASWLREPDGTQFLLGKLLPDTAKPVAQAYAGHQFGGYNPRLGDGRALLLGELVDGAGHRRDLQLKGSGPTPFSRGGDGYAAVGPMLREYVMGEAMHALGIPTTRALAVVATGDTVHRETPLPGAVLARVASSHLRVGTFQYAANHPKAPDLLRRLADYAIARHHPDAATAERPYLALYDAVIAAQATLIAQWMLVGFIHGVMNTDNMTISGETIDYGPCAFMEAFDPATVFSSIDHGGRYAYGNQPAIAAWNLARFGETLLPLLDDDQDTAVELATASLQGFAPQFETAWSLGMRAKVGLPVTDAATVGPLVEDFLVLLRDNHVDYTTAFRTLGDAARGQAEPARGLYADLAGFDAWAARWTALGPDADVMDRANPLYVPRNLLVEEALTAATQSDLAPFEQLVDVVTRPYDERPGLRRYTEPAPDDGTNYQTFCGT